MKKYENELYNQGFKNIAGLDEVGRGCWAGPLVVSICLFEPNYINPKINDSKKIKEKDRKYIFDEIIKDAQLVDWVVFDAEYVDKYNPKQTSINGMEYLIEKHNQKIDYCLIDAERIKSLTPFKSIIKGDQVSQSIAAASIVAKVIRDEIMKNLDKKYNNYSFSQHKGYGTKKHLEELETFGPIKGIHRFSYKPIKRIVEFKK